MHLIGASQMAELCFLEGQPHFRLLAEGASHSRSSFPPWGRDLGSQDVLFFFSN